MLGMDPINWYNEAQYWPVIIVLVYLWMTFGYNSILYYSTLIGIDKSYYEAASVDGAGVWAQIRYITLPALRPTIITLVLLAVGRICYSDFGLFYQVTMNSGLLYETTQTIDTTYTADCSSSTISDVPRQPDSCSPSLASSVYSPRTRLFPKLTKTAAYSKS